MIEDIKNFGPTGIEGAGGPTGTTGAARGGVAPAGGASFEDLLMRIQAMERAGGVAAAAGTKEGGGGLEDALHHAEDGFVAAMDLRKRLEQAFRKFVDA